jgi:isoaspartyl peptidase/L-asparaginase-like protein (Ntn-hydrolase superfamily)
MRPVLLVHAGAGGRSQEIDRRQREYCEALLTTLARARAVLEAGGGAVDAAQAAVMFMEDEVDFFNAGRGSTLCADGSVEMSAAIMRGSDREAGAVAGIRHARYPIAAARAVLDASPHVLLVSEAADRHAAAAGVEQRDPAYFITPRQQRRLADEPSRFERGTVGAVCLDAGGTLAAATSTGGMRGQLPGRVGDSPLIGAGTWADQRAAISCTGDGEAFIRAGAALQVASLVAAGKPIEKAAETVLADVVALGGQGGLIALDAHGHAALSLHAEAMPRGIWRAGHEPEVSA